MKEKLSSNSRVEMNNITMMFGNLIANDNVNLKIKRGEIHGLIGENGAGKSTLMSILFGLLKPTSGTILLNNHIEKIKSPNDANRLGIGMVHQHFQLVEDLNCLENIILGNEPGKRATFSLEVAEEEVQKIIDSYGFKVDLNKKIYDCSIAEQQKVEILKMLYLGNDLLIFDEPSAVLVPKEIENLLKSIEYLRSKGKTILLITHKLNEIKAVCNRATVLRKGRVIETFDVKNVSIDQMSEMMVGRKIIETKNTRIRKLNELAIKIENISSKRIENPKVEALKSFSIEGYRGEILAFAGVEGNGQRELFEILLGIHKPHNKNSNVFIYDNDNKEKNLLKMSIRERYASGLSYVPINRHKDAIVDEIAIKYNIVLNNFYRKPLSRLGIMNFKAIRDISKYIVDSHDVRGVDPSQSTSFSSLSGGNQQKAVVGREMSKVHNILVLFQPTRGLDVGAIQHIHKLIIDEKEKGKCILLISYELDEILALADRVVAMSSGENVGVLEKWQINRKRVGNLIAGH